MRAHVSSSVTTWQSAPHNVATDSLGCVVLQQFQGLERFSKHFSIRECFSVMVTVVWACRKGMGVSDQELRAFLKGGGPSSSSNPANVSSTELRKQFQDDGLLTAVRPPANTQSAPLPGDFEKLHGASVLSEPQAVLPSCCCVRLMYLCGNQAR